MSETTEQGRQPAMRHRAVQAIDRLETATNDLQLLSQWDYADLLPIAEADRLLQRCNELQHALAETSLAVAKAHAKRTGQSVSGRLQPQIDALRRHAQAIVDTPAESE